MRRQVALAISYLPSRIAEKINSLSEKTLDSIQEIRLRSDRPISITLNGENVFLSMDGTLQTEHINSITARKRELEDTFFALCKKSVYTHEMELREGFISLGGGARAGICGTAIYDAAGNMRGFKDISSINVRIPREMRGCARELKGYVLTEKKINGVIIVSPPNMGKTTLLKDIARMISENRYRVCVIDERGELNADGGLGILTDVIVGLPKAKGIELAIRTMSPQAVICDEIGTEKEAESLIYSINSGVAVIATCHADSYEAFIKKKGMERVLASGAVKYVVELCALSKVGRVVEVKW